MQEKKSQRTRLLPNVPPHPFLEVLLEKAAQMASSFSFIVTTLTLLFPTNPVTLLGRAASALCEAIGQWASDSDLLILCNCNDGSHPTRPQGSVQGSQSLALGTLLQTIMGHRVCHRIIVLKCLWTGSCSKHSGYIYVFFGYLFHQCFFFACSASFLHLVHELCSFSAL